MRILLLATTLVAAAGCNVGTFHYDSDGSGGSGGAGGAVGAGGSGGSGGSMGQQYFQQNVAPNLSSKCSACHMGSGPGPGGAPTFLGAQPNGFYAAIRSDARMYTPAAPSTSLLITKGAHEGPAWTTGEAANIHDWLVLEGSSSVHADAGATDGP